MAAFYNRGRYSCQIKDQGVGEAKTGTPQFVLRFQVLEKQVGAEWEPCEVQYERTAYLAITDRTMEYFVRKMHALGFSHGSLRFLDPSTPGYHNFSGQMADFVCNVETDQNGDTKEKWDLAFGNEGEPLELRPVDANKMRHLDNLFGAANNKERKPAQPRQTAPAQRPAPAQRTQSATAVAEPPPAAPWTPGDEDVPF